MYAPLVKWLRRIPFTDEAQVQFLYGVLRGVAQLVEYVIARHVYVTATAIPYFRIKNFALLMPMSLVRVQPPLVFVTYTAYQFGGYF